MIGHMDRWPHIEKNSRQILKGIYEDVGWQKMVNLNTVMREARKRNFYKLANDIWQYKGESYDYIITALVPRYAVVIS